jgi:hypothetical protein
VQLFGNLKFDWNDVLCALLALFFFILFGFSHLKKSKRQFLDNPSKIK